MIVTADKCSKCKNPLFYTAQGNGVKQFTCGHTFHISCLSRDSAKCPICRAIEVGVKVAAYAGGAIAGAVLAPLVAPVALGLVGFGAAGPIAGSLAAIVQGTIGNVAAGSLFAMAQSVAMGGALPALGYAAGATVGGAAAAAVAENAPVRVGEERKAMELEAARK